MKQKTMKKIAAVIAAIMAFVMVFGLVSSLFSMGLTASEQNLKKLKEELAAATKAKKESEEALKKIQEDQKNINNEIIALDKKVSAMESEIDLHNSVIAELANSIAQKETDVANMQVKEDDQYGKLKSRVRVMYESGDLSYLGILLESDSFYDFLSRYEIVSQISTYEKKMFEQIKATKESIIVQKQSLEAEKQEEVALKQTLESNKQALDKQLNDRANMMARLENAEEDEKSKVEALEDAMDKANAEVVKMAAELAAKDKGDYTGGTFTWPAPGYTRITSNFGMRYHPVLHVNKLHTGTDIGAPKNAKIVAATAGTVVTATYSSSLGNYVMIDHGGGIMTLYAHMTKSIVSKGAKVTKGQQIGLVGSTGYSTGPHLHFEVIKNGQYQNPMSYFN